MDNFLSEIIGDKEIYSNSDWFRKVGRICDFIKIIIKKNNIDYVDIFNGDDGIITIDFCGNGMSEDPILDLPRNIFKIYTGKTKRFILFPFVILNFGMQSHHCNFIIIDTLKKEIERFEPIDLSKIYDGKVCLTIDRILRDMLLPIFSDYQYI